MSAPLGSTAPEYAHANRPGALMRRLYLRQVHGMQSIDAVAERLVAEIGSRSKASAFAAAAADQQQAVPKRDGDTAAGANGPAETAQT